MISNLRLVTAAIAMLCFCVPSEVSCEPMGNLQVTLLPAGAISAGAMWRVVGETTWHASGDTIGYPIDDNNLEFSVIPGWRTPQTRTMSVPEDGIVTTIATYQPSTIVVADSLADFSFTQGGNGWYYGYSSSGWLGFHQYTTTGTDSRGAMWTGGAGALCRLWPQGGHPDSSIETVRRWISTVSGPVQISGNMWKLLGSNYGNGFIGSVYINGTQKYSKGIAYNDNTGVPYTCSTTLAIGDVVDFPLNCLNANTDSDHCGFTSVIKTPVSTGSLRVNIAPSAAAVAGAKWRRVGTSTWFSSGEIEYDVPVGSYSIEPSTLPGGEPPALQAVTIIANQTCVTTVTYPTGSLHLTIQPASAVTEGAQWRRVGTTTWLESGATETGIVAGNHSVEFGTIESLAPPAVQIATIESNQTCEIIGTYTPWGMLKVNILPTLAVTGNGQWRRVGTTTWLNSGDTDIAPAGDCTVEFKRITGWRQPTTRTFTVSSGQTAEQTGTYRGGPIVAWGSNSNGQCSPPTLDSEFVAVAGGRQFGAGLRSDGSVALWGYYNGGIPITYVPYPNSDFVAIACGSYHALGLKSDGSIVGWVNNELGQCNVPSPNSGYLAIDGGEYHSIALRSDGSVVAWGDNSHGQCELPSPNSGFVSVAAGASHSMAVRTDGSIAAWGSNSSGQLGVPSPNSDFASLSSWGDHSLGLKSDGSIVGWGYNASNQCVTPSPNSDFIAVAGGRIHSVALRSDTSIAAWGYNYYGECTVPSPNSGFLAVGAGDGFSLAIKGVEPGALRVTIAPEQVAAADGKWRRSGTSTWYSSGEIEYDVPSGSHSIEFIDVAGWSNPAPLGVTIIANQTLEASGTYQPSGQLQVTIQPAEAIAGGAKWRRIGTTQWLASGETELDVHLGSCEVEFSKTTTFATPAAQTTTIVSNQTSEVTGTYVPGGTLKVNILPALSVKHKAQWRRVGTTPWLESGDTEILPPGSTTIEFKKLVGWTEPATRTLSIVAGKTSETTGTYHGGTVVAWGRNDYRQCVPPSPSYEFVAVAGGLYYGIGLRSDGTIAAWGQNWAYNIPWPNSDFVAISGGSLHALGLKSDGSIVPWGDSRYGKLIVPSPNSGFVAVDGGWDHSIALRADGSVAVWGDNTYGQCNPLSPNSGFTAVAAGSMHSLALRADGSVVAWGFNNDGQCDVASPNSGFSAISAPAHNSLALKSDGSIAGWGYNYFGQSDPPSPNSGFLSVSGHANHSVALKSDGSIVVWGDNLEGELNIPSPNSGFAAVNAAFNLTMAIRRLDTGSLRVTTSPADGKWRRTGTSTWYASGDTEYDLMADTYTVEFIDLAGYTKPSPVTASTNTQLTELAASYIATAAIPLPQVKKNPDGTAIHVSGVTVSAAWPDAFYVQTADRACGIRVEKPSHGLIYGDLADVVGTLATNASGERFIQASTATKTGDGGAISPLGTTNRNVGGASLLDTATGFGQLGVLNGSGLNNIGLFVRTSGRVVEIEPVTSPTLPTWFKIDDGSGARIKCVVPSGVFINAGWSHVSVTGVSSCENVGADIIRLIRIRTADDIVSN